MTPIEAAALALLGFSHRRFLAVLLRHATGRATAEDEAAMPPRATGETLLAWACRAAHGLRRDGGCDWAQLERDARSQIARGARVGAAAIPVLDPRFPEPLAAIPDPPPLLWVRGVHEVLRRPAVAIVGSRAATTHGLAMAKTLSEDLAAAGIVVVSGLARGVDSAAHTAAVSAKGATIGVLGCGIDRVYPSEHHDLAREMESRGAVISEFPAGVPPLAHHFPLRNRIISGLSSAVVIVEAPEKSGALITASAALEQGREVMVVPGPVLGGRNRGGHLLIRDGATLVESANDILQELGAAAAPAPEPGAMPGLDRLPKTVDFTVDEVVRQTGESPDQALARLLELELAGRIQRIGGGRFTWGR